ncbi:hypothetical protein HK101_006166, partial [Irineochytrium annulatum]
FELYSDLFLADHLIQTSRATSIVFHAKTIPWFVSDTTPTDVDWLLSSLSDPSTFFTITDQAQRAQAESVLKPLADRWRAYFTSGTWIVRPDPVWCTGWAHHHLPEIAPWLWTDLVANSRAVVFKGDLNYRKLIYDCRWPATTPFEEAIGEALRAAPFSVVALRTNKSDGIVGVEGSLEEKLNAGEEKDWRWSGRFAVVQCKK